MQTIAVLALLVGIGASSWAATPDASSLAKQMKAALEPAGTSVRKLEITVSTESGESTRIDAAEARKITADGSRMLTVLLSPEPLRGIAVLVEERADEDAVRWVYAPSVRRVRKIVGAAKYQPFVESDFTYADLGFVDRSPTYKLLGTETRDGTVVYKLEEVPRETWHYSRIVDFIASDTSLPIRREFYDPANQLWKVEELRNVTTVDGVPTPLTLRMEDVQQHGSSEIKTTDVRYRVAVPDALFAAKSLPEAASSPLWTAPVR